MEPEVMGVQPEMQPQSPMGIQPGSVPDGDEMPQEEMRRSLLDMYGKVRAKKQEWDTTKNVSEVKLAEAKINAIRQFFESFEKAGIDPADPEAMRQFFDQLYEKNPDLYELIVPVIDSLLGPGDDEMSPMGAMQGGGGGEMMNQEVGP